MRRVAALVCCLLGLLNPLPVAGQTLDPHVLAFIAGDAHRAAVLAVARDQARGLPGACADATYRAADDVAFYLPPRLDGGGRIVHGVWRERVLAEGCGTIELLNVFSLATATGEPKLLGGLPGTTRADLVLQREALPLAVHGLPASAAACRDVRIVDTAVAPDAASDPQAPWREDWTVLACDKAYPISLRFTPGPGGATIVIDGPHPSP